MFPKHVYFFDDLMLIQFGECIEEWGYLKVRRAVALIVNEKI